MARHIGRALATSPSAIAPKAPPQLPAQGDKTLTKGLQLLEALSQGDGARGISELALALSLTKSNVHRLLQTLSRCGYVTREAGTDRYLLSSKLWQMSHRGKPFDALRRQVRPVLQSLVDETHESAVFVVVENDDLVLIDQVETQNPVRVVFFTVGQSFPIDRVVMSGKGLTALQLIALAHRPQIEARMSELVAVRKNGAAFSRGEWVSGVNAVAVPVMDASRGLIGVLSCFGPADRIPEGRLKKLQKTLSLKAQELSRRLGE